MTFSFETFCTLCGYSRLLTILNVFFHCKILKAPLLDLFVPALYDAFVVVHWVCICDTTFDREQE